MPEKHVLLATLGGQPQVVTFTLDLLLLRYPISDVIVLHPAPSQERLQRSLDRLRSEFTGDYYQPTQRTMHFRSQVLLLDGQAVQEINSDRAADGVLDTLHKLIGDLKRQDYTIHLSVTGGRRLMSLLAVSVATLNFDRHDHIWHIYTPEAFQQQADEGRIMHAPPEAGITLIEAPFLSLGAYVYYSAPSFRSAQEEQRIQRDAQERIRCKQVVEQSTPAQRKVLQALSQGLRPQQVADQLCINIRTVHKHTSVLLNLCYNAWSIDPHESLDYHFLYRKFAGYFPET